MPQVSKTIKIGMSDADKQALKEELSVAIIHEVVSGSITIDGETTNISQKITEINNTIESKANVDGYYSTMRVGQSDSIASEREIENAENACPPITIGTTGGNVEIQTGYNTFEYLEGNSVAFNQLCQNSTSTQTINGVTFTNNGDGSWTINGTATANAYKSIQPPMNAIANHKYLIKGTTSDASSDTITLVDSYSGVGSYIAGEGKIVSTTTDKTFQLAIFVSNGATISNKVFRPQIFDLTLMGLDSITNVEEFNRLFPKPYYEYNEGTLISTKSSSVEFIGQNQFDGEWIIGKLTGSSEVYNCSSVNFIPVIPGETYALENGTDVSKFTIDSNGWYLFEYDANKNLIKETNKYDDLYTPNSRKIFTLTYQTKFIKFYIYSKDANFQTNGFPSTFTFRLYHNTPNIPYKEYEKQVVKLPNIELRSAGNAKDIAYSIGGGKRRVGVVDLVTLNWTYYAPTSAYPYGFFTANVSGKANASNNLRCVLYTTTIDQPFTHDKNIVATSTNGVYIVDSSYTDATTFKQAMSGVMLYYELAEETDISLVENPGWTRLVKVDNHGVIKFNSEDTIQVPQPYFIRYTISLTEFLDSAYVKTNGIAKDIVIKEELEEVNTKHDALYDIIMNNLGGMLRHKLADKENIDFDNTTWIDLLTLNWNYEEANLRFVSDVITNLDVPTYGQSQPAPSVICTKYKTVNTWNIDQSSTDCVISTNNSTGQGRIFIKDSSLNGNVSAFKNAIKGILIAYKKA